MLILDVGSLDEVGRYLHLNPVRIHGLGLSKKDQRRVRVMECENPGMELVSRRIATLRSHRLSSWRVYSGVERHGDWGRNGILAVATRHLGWRLVEVVRRLPGLGHSAAAQGIRRFWQLTPHRPKMQVLEKALVAKLSIVQVCPIPSFSNYPDELAHLEARSRL